jgi:hypothetical protein
MGKKRKDFLFFILFNFLKVRDSGTLNYIKNRKKKRKVFFLFSLVFCMCGTLGHSIIERIGKKEKRFFFSVFFFNFLNVRDIGTLNYIKNRKKKRKDFLFFYFV